VIKGSDLIAFLNDYAAAYGAFDLSDSSDADPSAVAGPAPKRVAPATRAKPMAARIGADVRRAARAAGAVTQAQATAVVRGRRPGR
jgi:hypothetical protein